MPDGNTWPDSPMSWVRHPRLRMLLNGNPLNGNFEASVSSNNRLAADTWDATLAMDLDPAFGWAFWGEQQDATITIQVGFLADSAAEGSVAEWVSLITGKIDDIHVDPGQGTVHMSGRDLTSLLIDKKIQKAYANLTTSQILTMFAKENGLVADVTPTTRLVGDFYKDEHDKLALGNFSKQTSEWEMACYLARQEDQDIWIDDKGLHTKPAADPGGTGVVPYPIHYVPRDQHTPIASVNYATDIQVERSLTLAKDIRVTVKTWDAAHKTSYTRTVDGHGSVTAKEGAGGAGKAPAQTYVFVKPGLDPDAALRFAQQQARVLTLLERVVTLEMPGELTLTPRSMVSLSGTGTSWDQTYYIDTIARKVSWGGGFTQTVRLKNSSPRTMTTVS